MKEVLAGRYQLLAVVGTGGTARVYRSLDTRLDRIVAVKLLAAPSLAAGKKLVQDAELQRRVDHPHVCRIYESGWDEHGAPYVVMELIEGESLAQRAPLLTIGEKVSAVRDAALGVQAAHEAGLIHLDLRPRNILLERATSRPVLTGFLDLEVSLSASTGAAIGTPNSMAPEQVRGDLQALGPHTDVYGLGATLYELLSGAPPFHGATRMEVLERVVRDDPAPLDPALPAALRAIVGRAMEKDPARRIRGARALADELQGFLQGRPPPVPEPAWARRKPFWIGIALGLTLAAAGAWLVVDSLRTTSGPDRAAKRAAP